ncbi:uncharacterized protein [Arachis hypogaea]|uniref:uncharacterized protein n=1 Tax=Arachis hypogaea TaxID=3818 RepID=UPI000DECBECC
MKDFFAFRIQERLADGSPLLVVGYPELFLTFTCNPKWPEFNFLKNRDLNAEDRPDMVCQTFKVKLDRLIQDIRENNIFRRVVAVVYTIEYQKHGLPQAYILVFLHRDDKYPAADDIDQIISAEITDKDRDPLYYEVVEKNMMYGSCRSIKKDSPCMENGKCIRHFPKKFVNNTTIDDDGYPIYRRRDDGKTISKCGVELDNRNDRATASFYNSSTTDVENDECDEVSMYYDCRYISLCEAPWRIFGYRIHFRDPSMVRLGFHLPGEQPVIFQDHENLKDVVKKASVKESMFLGWFKTNKKYSEAQRSGKIYYVQLLLNFVRSPTSSEDIRTIDGILYPTFRDACYLQGILDDDKEYIDAVEEANLHMTETEIRDLTLIEIENLLKGYNKSLRDIPSMPFPNIDMCYQQLMSNSVNRLICDEFRYDRRQLVVEHADLLQKLTNEQKRVYKQILAAANSGDGGVFLLYGYGGTGKTFVWKILAATIRSKDRIVLMVASLLLPGGRTAYSRFAISINFEYFSTCSINQNSPLVELIIRCKLIIWDEAPMVNRFCIETLNRTMREILRFKNANSLQQPFGGKTVVFGEDFPQYYLCKLLSLTQNMQLRVDTFDERNNEVKQFIDQILSIGDGQCGDLIDGIDKIRIPDDILID